MGSTLFNCVLDGCLALGAAGRTAMAAGVCNSRAPRRTQKTAEQSSIASRQSSTDLVSSARYTPQRVVQPIDHEA